ncbi:uncharacterized protein N7515_007366 [Penicillium bovifimosum]|uniref:Uncharacterized protein n=1 Tax=Penicillium bovifimosum TaxID=126998 RepID=A0A9W9L252_9EURO|nr:uncharacterized protein N7515_007366 [Penicillium bovifimosum]KAJ5131327.1 hypothetical protein N7515_007366 [Penicillium bovifimosum]
MHSWIPFLPYLLFLVSTYASGVEARRGGGGGDSDDYYTGDNSGGGSSSGSTDSCHTPRHPTVWKWDLISRNADNYTSGGVSGEDTSYDGSFFKGEASFHYTITEDEMCTYGNMRGTEHTMQMLGYVWVGPQAPYPVGPTNPIIIGFKAWESSKPLDEIGDSYGYIQWDEDGIACPSYPDLIRITTTYGWFDFDTRSYGAMDVMNMAISEAPGPHDQGRVRFNATMPDKLDHETDLLLRIPGSYQCTNDYDYMFDTPPERLAMNGSFTNTTFDLTLSGKGNASSETTIEKRQLTTEFRLTFSGVFDGDNSTEKLSLRQPGQPLVTWVANSGLRLVSVGWMTGLICLGVLMVFM